MISEFSALTHERQRKRNFRRRLYILIGVLLITLGYWLVAVEPGTAANWLLVRTFAGLGCVVVGFGMAVLPLLSSWTSGD